MKRSKLKLTSGLLFVGLFACTGQIPAAAQTTYKCQSNGTIYYADRPCSHEAGVAVKTADTEERKIIAKPASVDLGMYLRGRCASLYYQIKNFQSSGQRGEYGHDSYHAAEEARSQYEQSCDSQDSAARQKMRQALDANQYAMYLAQESQEQQRRQAVAKQAQCAEMGRIYKSKMAKLSTMSLGEKQDFARFEQGFKERCLPSN